MKIPRGSILLIPESDAGRARRRGVRPGYYGPFATLALIERHKHDPKAIQFIADMLESGNPENDAYSRMLRASMHSVKGLTYLVNAAMNAREKAWFNSYRKRLEKQK